MMMMSGWYAGTVATLLVLFIYFAFFFKINYVKDMSKPQKSRGSSKNRKLGQLPPVYPNGWFALLESWQIKKGQVKHVSALGENFAVFRTEKGVVNILDAYCPHLGANIGENGRVAGECLECPFHSWKFRGEDGRCESIPYAEKVPHIAQTKAWKCCEVNHLIFVWYHSELIEPDWQPQPYPAVADGTWRFHGRNEFLINCHIQEIAENGADFSHMSAVHSTVPFPKININWIVQHMWAVISMWRPYSTWNPETVLDGTEVQIKLNDSNHRDVSNGGGDDGGDDGGGDNRLTIADDNPDKKITYKASMRMHHSLLLFKRFTLFAVDVNVEQNGPGYVFMLLKTGFGPVCFLQTVTPLEPLVQRVTHQVFAPRLLAPLASMMFLAECLMFKRDIVIWNHKRYERQPVLVREDRTIMTFRRWYSQFYTARSPTYQTATRNLQW